MATRTYRGRARQHGYPVAAANTEDRGSARFAERFGFVDVDRQVEQVRAIAGDEPEPTAPVGVSIVAVSERPELWLRAYHEIGLAGLADMAVSAPMEVSLAEWEAEWIADPAATFLALDREHPLRAAADLMVERHGRGCAG